MPPKPKQNEPQGSGGLLQLLAELKLSTLALELPDVLRWAETEQPDFTTFLTRALVIERDGRRERRLDRLLRAAHLRTAPTLDDFNFSIRAKLSARAVKELGRCRFVEEGRNILCFGKSSTGKTHVAKALGRNACLLGKKTYFTIASELLDELIAAEEEGTFRRLWRRYTRCDLLILDEAGYAPFDKRHANLLFRLVAARYEEKRSIILTSNTAFRRWGALFPSEAQAVATVERLIDRASILRFSGKGCRPPKEILGATLDDDDDDDTNDDDTNNDDTNDDDDDD